MDATADEPPFAEPCAQRDDDGDRSHLTDADPPLPTGSLSSAAATTAGCIIRWICVGGWGDHQRFVVALVVAVRLLVVGMAGDERPEPDFTRLFAAGTLRRFDRLATAAFGDNGRTTQPNRQRIAAASRTTGDANRPTLHPRAIWPAFAGCHIPMAQSGGCRLEESPGIDIGTLVEESFLVETGLPPFVRRSTLVEQAEQERFSPGFLMDDARDVLL